MPVIVQDVGSGAVLMLAWAEPRGGGADAGHRRGVVLEPLAAAALAQGGDLGEHPGGGRVTADCDGDALLVRARPAGPACHRGTRTCFEPNPAQLELGWLGRLSMRERPPRDPAESYTARLLAGGVDRIAQKVGEEAVEVVIAALAAGGLAAHSRGAGEHREAGALTGEAADLIYHLLVLLQASGVDVRVAKCAAELLQRHGGARRHSTARRARRRRRRRASPPMSDR